MMRWLARMTGGQPRSVAIPAHDPVITLQGDRAKRYFSRIEASLARLREEYDLFECKGREYGQLDNDLRRFSQRGNPNQLRLLHAYALRNDQAAGHWFTFTYLEKDGGSRTGFASGALRQGAMFNTLYNAGDVFIRPEGITDTVNEWFDGVEIDFPDFPQFCWQYYVLAASGAELRKHLPREVLEILSLTSGLFVRMLSHQVLVATDRTIRPSETARLVEIAAAIGRCE